MRPSGPTVSECSSLATGMPASVVVGLRLSFVMIAPPLCLRVNRRESFRSSFFLESHPDVGRNEDPFRIVAELGGDMRRRGSNHSAGAVGRGPTSILSSASNFIALWIKAATRAPTIGAITYSQASVKLAVAIIGPNEIAGLKLAPVKLPAIMMLRATVIPIAIGAKLLALRAYAVVSTTMTRKKASTASITNPAAGVIVSAVAPRATFWASSGRPRPVATPPRTARKRNAAQAPATIWLIM